MFLHRRIRIKYALAILSLLALAPLTASAADGIAEAQTRGGLPNAGQRLTSGETVRVAYLGGSITEAGIGWRPQMTKWLSEQYPKAKVEEIKASISGSGSLLGVFRLQDHVLAHKPNLLLIEFAVNDSNVKPKLIERAMEGIVRKTWTADPTTDIAFVYTLQESHLKDYNAGQLPPSAVAMEAVATHYGIPTIVLGTEVAKKVAAGELLMRGDEKTSDKPLFASDGTHPNAHGFTYYMETLKRHLPTCFTSGTPGPHAMPKPLHADNLVEAKFVPVTQSMLTGGWELLPADDQLMKQYGASMPQIWRASGPGDVMTVKFTGTTLGAYDLTGPDSGELIVTVDGGAPKTIKRFNSWGNHYQRRWVMFAEDLKPGEHTVTIKVSDQPIDKAAILAARKITIDDPKKYEPQRWHVGSLMVVGEVAQ